MGTETVSFGFRGRGRGLKLLTSLSLRPPKDKLLEKGLLGSSEGTTKAERNSDDGKQELDLSNESWDEEQFSPAEEKECTSEKVKARQKINVQKEPSLEHTVLTDEIAKLKGGITTNETTNTPEALIVEEETSLKLEPTETKNQTEIKDDIASETNVKFENMDLPKEGTETGKGAELMAQNTEKSTENVEKKSEDSFQTVKSTELREGKPELNDSEENEVEKSRSFDPRLLKAVNAPEFRFDSVLVKAVNSPEFVPRTFIPIETKENEDSNAEKPARKTSRGSPTFERPPFLRTPSQGEDQIALDAFKDAVYLFTVSPADFDEMIDQLTEILVAWISEEGTMDEIVSVLIEQAITEPNFRYSAARIAKHFDQTRALEIHGGLSFRRSFFQCCQMQFRVASELMNDPKNINEENEERLVGLAFFFGELLCTMKVWTSQTKDAVNEAFKRGVYGMVDKFLENPTNKRIACLTKLLKLVGPTLDRHKNKGQLKDVDEMFDKVRDFCIRIGSIKSEHLTDTINIKKNLFAVYKLHTRDWDRDVELTPTSTPTEEKPFNLARQSSYPEESLDVKAPRSSSPPIDWDDYADYADEDEAYEAWLEMYGNESEADEMDAAFEEFLIESGQA